MSGKHFLRKTEINETNVAFFVDHQVFRLQVPVAIVARVHIIEGVDNAAGVKSGDCVFEWTFVAKSAPEIATEIRVGQNIHEFFI